MGWRFNREYLAAPHRASEFFTTRSVVVQKSTSPLRVERASASRRGASWYKRVPRRSASSERVLHDAERRGTKEYLAAPHRASEFFTTRSVVVQKSASPLRIERASSSRRGASWYKRVPRRSASSERVLHDAERRGTEEYLAAPHRASEFFTTRSVVVQKSISPLRVERASSSRRGASWYKRVPRRSASSERVLHDAERRGTEEYLAAPRRASEFFTTRSVVVQKSISPLRIERASSSRRGASWYKRVPRRSASSERVLHDAERRGTKEYLAAPHRASEFFTTRSVVVQDHTITASGSGSHETASIRMSLSPDGIAHWTR